MFTRRLTLPPPGTRTFFLWGPRQVGKTTLLRQCYPDAFWVDLLLEPQPLRADDGIEILPLDDFLDQLWSGALLR